MPRTGDVIAAVPFAGRASRRAARLQVRQPPAALASLRRPAGQSADRRGPPTRRSSTSSRGRPPAPAAAIGAASTRPRWSPAAWPPSSGCRAGACSNAIGAAGRRPDATASTVCTARCSGRPRRPPVAGCWSSTTSSPPARRCDRPTPRFAAARRPSGAAGGSRHDARPRRRARRRPTRRAGPGVPACAGRPSRSRTSELSVVEADLDRGTRRRRARSRRGPGRRRRP